VSQIFAQVGLPSLPNAREAKMSKMLYELRDRNDLIRYAYFYSTYTGKFTYLGKCIGYPIPYATQYSSPTKISYRHGGWTTVPQSEPNGLFMPSSAEGTWVLLVNPNTRIPEPTYLEERVNVFANQLLPSQLSNPAYQDELNALFEAHK
jgi:hypothetical protein